MMRCLDQESGEGGPPWERVLSAIPHTFLGRETFWAVSSRLCLEPSVSAELLIPVPSACVPSTKAPG